MMGSGPWRMLADDGHVAYCFLMGASTNQKTVCYAAYHPQMLLIIRLTKQSALIDDTSMGLPPSLIDEGVIF